MVREEVEAPSKNPMGLRHDVINTDYSRGEYCYGCAPYLVVDDGSNPLLEITGLGRFSGWIIIRNFTYTDRRRRNQLGEE